MTPEIGITGTPVVDTSTNSMYMVAKTKEVDLRAHTTNFYQTLHELDLRTGVDPRYTARITAQTRVIGTGTMAGSI